MSSISDELQKLASAIEVLDPIRAARLAGIADRIELTDGRDAIRESITVDIQGLMHSTVVNIPSSLTHANPDSWEQIADELEAWCDHADVDGDACDVPRELAVRIRKLAEREQGNE